MILVPAETVDRLKEPAPTTGRPLVDWDREATRILNDPDLGDAEKMTNYLQIMQRLWRFNEQRRKPLKILFGEQFADQPEGIAAVPGQQAAQEKAEDLPVENPPENPAVSLKTAPDQRKPTLDSQAITSTGSQLEEILETVPKSYRAKGSILLNRLNKSDMIQWSDDGGVKIDGKAIQGTNIADLVNDALRSRKTAPPPQGSEEFCNVLAKMNVPQELIGNTQRWELIRELATEQTSPDSPVYDTLWPQTPAKNLKRNTSPDTSDHKLTKVRRNLNWEDFNFEE